MFVTFLAILAVLSLVIHLLSEGVGPPARWSSSQKSKPFAKCPSQSDWLGSLDIAFPINYARRDIVIMPGKTTGRSSLTRVEGPLLPELELLDLSKASRVELKNCKDALFLEMPGSEPPTDASHIMFGISTTLKHLDQSIPQLLRWLPNTKAQLFVIAVTSASFGHTQGTVFATATEKEALQSKMRHLGMDVTIVDPLERNDTFAERQFSLVKLLHSQAGEDIRWISLIDEDTFIPSMPALNAMLGKYDAQQQYYIGALSENWTAVAQHGLMASAGAGIFISRPLSQILFDHYETCKHSSSSNAGDIRIMECVYQFTTTKLTNERRLHQVDVLGDLSGFFESGPSLLSLHHWKPRNSTSGGGPVPMMHTVADVCKDCFLQRWQFGPDTILANGFSISYYPKGHLKKVNLDLIEETWDPMPPIDFSVSRITDHSFGQSRPKLRLDEEKVQFRLLASAAVDGGVRQAYYHPGLDGDMDSLLELFWSVGESSHAV